MANIQELQQYKDVEKSILQATREYQDKLRAIQPDIKLSIHLSNVSTPKEGSNYCLTDESTVRVTVYDKNHLPF